MDNERVTTELIGLQALKPHRTGVTALCLTVEHKLLASAGEDRTVYLYKVFVVNLFNNTNIYRSSP